MKYCKNCKYSKVIKVVETFMCDPDLISTTIKCMAGPPVHQSEYDYAGRSVVDPHHTISLNAAELERPTVMWNGTCACWIPKIEEKNKM